MKKLLNSLAFASLLGASGALHAATISFSDLDNPMETTEISQSLNFGLFDTALGTLNSVTLTLGAAFDTIITLTNHSPSPESARGTLSLDIFFSSTLAGLDTYLAGNGSDLLLSRNTGFQSLAADPDGNGPLPGGSYTSGTLSDSATSIETDPTLDVNWFTQAGGGGFTIACDSLASTTVTGAGGNVDLNQVTTAGCTGTITYDYSPASVSEPETLALMGLGLMGMAWRRRTA